jgi:hypothetical protein
MQEHSASSLKVIVIGNGKVCHVNNHFHIHILRLENHH